MMDTFLVTGAGGQLGRAVVDMLLDQGQAGVIAASRSPERLSDLAARGATTIEADFDRPETLDAAFAGVGALLIVSTDHWEVPGRRRRQHLAAIDAARRSGIGRIVYTSMPDPTLDSPVPFAPDHLATEQAIERSGIPATILRNNWYAESLLFSLPGSLKAGTWYSAAGDGKVAYVAKADAARAAAAALIAPEIYGTLDVTGPEALTASEVAALVTETTGRKLQVQAVSETRLRDQMKAHVDAPLCELIAGMDVNTRLGRVARITDTVERLTGTRPTSLRDVLAGNLDALNDPG